jgi:Tfp pilus tip-associated adhesin PilY1
MLPSTKFPGWLGHFYAFDTTQAPTDTNYVLWDAGDQTKLKLPGTLTAAQVAALKDPANRKIYTWDSSKNLVAVTTANVAQLQTIAGAFGLVPPTKFSANVVNFIRGYDANSTPVAWTTRRTWTLGPMINTTPALQGPPIVFKQTTVKPHAPFESLYKTRHTLVWVGSDDGMMHAIDFETGLEELAIIPPNLLPLQVQLFNNYMIPNKATGKPGDRLTGQPDHIAAHLYGVANSFRFGDVWFQTDNSYHTVGIISEGPGGNSIAAIDVTHPYGGNADLGTVADPNYVSGSPFTVLWSVTGGSGAGQLNGLFSSWSVPAMAPTVNDTWDVLFGGGANPASTAAGQVAPKIFSANLSTSPTNPTFSSFTLTNKATPLVGNQAFADSVAFSTLASAFHSDNLATLGVQADLNGQLWFQTGTDLSGSRYVGIDASAIAGLATQQPVYYSPAVTGYGPSATSCDIIAFGSGSFYEKSTKVTGPNVGSGSNFIPQLYIGVNPKPATGAPAAALAASKVLRIPITGTTFFQDSAGTLTRTLGAHTQLTASPFVISPLAGAGPAQVLFLVYDPDVGCTGESYVISITFPVTTTACAAPTPTRKIAYDAGAGAASGFAIAGDTLIVSKSGLGTDGRAGLYQPPNVVLATGSHSEVRPVWWKEHK